jgi:uncharacterized protein (DUF2267 family)
MSSERAAAASRHRFLMPALLSEGRSLVDYNQYIKLVKQRALFTGDEEVVTAVRAALEVLGQRLSEDEADELAALLPKEMKPYLRHSGAAETFRLNEFLARMAAKEGVEPALARYHARAILSLIAATVPTKELLDLLARLPRDIRDLFEVGNRVKRAAA